MSDAIKNCDVIKYCCPIIKNAKKFYFWRVLDTVVYIVYFLRKNEIQKYAKDQSADVCVCNTDLNV